MVLKQNYLQSIIQKVRRNTNNKNKNTNENNTSK